LDHGFRVHFDIQRVFGRPGAGWGVVYALALSLMILIDRPTIMGANIWKDGPRFESRNEYVRLRRGLDFLSRQHFPDAPLFWIDPVHAANEMPAYSRSYLMCASQPFPTVDPDTWFRPGRHFIPGYDVVTVSGRKNLEHQVDAAFASLGLAAHETAKSTVSFKGEEYELLVDHVDRRIGPPLFPDFLQPAEPSPSALRLTGVYVPVARTGAPTKFPIDVTTPAQPWAFGKILPVGPADLTGPLWIVIHARVVKGPVGIGVLDRAGRDFLYRTSVTASPQRVKISLPVGLLAHAGDIVIQSWARGSSAQLQIDDVEVFLQPGAP
jgi:hypothetical protein